MNREHSLWTQQSGITYLELVVVIAMLAVICAFGIPMLINVTAAQRTQGSAQELVAVLNQARRLAITQNISFSVEVLTNPQNQFRFCTGTATPCPGGAVWLGPTTAANGWMVLANGDRITLGPQITFNTLGAATAAGTLRVQNTGGTSCLDVVVGASGRIRIAPAGACP